MNACLQDCSWAQVRGLSLAHSGNPVRAWVRLAGVGLLHAYRDPRQLCTAIGSLLGARSGSWVRPPGAAREGWVAVCAYSADDVRFKRLVMELLLEQLSALADRTVLIILPDRAVTLEDPDHVCAWARHRELLRELVAETPRAALMDLVDGGAQPPEFFLDHVHLKAAGTRIQQELFEYRLTELGVR